MNYTKGYINPWWPDDFKNLNYKFAPFTDLEKVNEWKKFYGDQYNFGGEAYDMSQLMPEYASPFFNLMGWKDTTITFFKMNCGDLLPIHSDRYTKYRSIFNVSSQSAVSRCIVFLEDWKSGHYIEVDGDPLLPWKKGDYMFWREDTVHFAGNFGIEPRYTLQITGHHDI